MLSACQIHKSFGANRVLAGVDVDLHPGTITTLIGPSGSGKSTLLRSLALLDPPDAGVIKWNDTEYRFPPEAASLPPPWPFVTVVFQQLFLWPHLTLRQNIELPLLRHGRSAASSAAADVINEIGIENFVDRFPNEVSLGQRQLTAIARAFALEPGYLLLDEITSALDVEFVTRILDLIKVRRDKGVGVLIITHAIGFARKSADQVLFLDDSHIIESGTPEILDKPATARLGHFLSLVFSAV